MPFTKGHTINVGKRGWNKNKKTPEAVKRKISVALKGKKKPPRTKEHRQNLSLSGKGKHKGSSNGMWKGDKATYEAIHIWLSSNYGSPKKCNFCGEIGKKIKAGKKTRWTIEWAVKKGCKCERKRENFICLCIKCHRSYDEVIKKMWKIRKLNKNKCTLTQC